MKIAVHCNHIDHGGGGTYSHFLIKSLLRREDVYITNDHPEFISYWGDKLDLPRWTGGTPDVFVCIDHRGDIAPLGVRNFRVFFYPFEDMPNARLYDAAIVMNDFVGRAVVKKLGMYPYVVPIGLDSSRYRVGLNLDKENILLVVSNFFKEPDGHSKHQDKIIEWFRREHLDDYWRLVLVGGGQEDYYNYCQALTEGNPRIQFTGQLSIAEVAKWYTRAKFLIHANGYGRADESQTEHFGIVAVEAMLAGCQPIVHNSGGCREINGVWTWETWEGLTRQIQLATNPVQLRRRGEVYSPSRMNLAVDNVLGGLSGQF